ncbi:Protein kinase domain [Dillenia turbinata]|uniref:Protein kinase domain n=1 Tax=Dillenia turbinata TaxID=194707 RepID=A0AAN8V8U7_9MAGN
MGNQRVAWFRGSCIGKGSFGTVNLAFKKSNGAVFAVKSVNSNPGIPSQVEALENEIRILRSLSSAYVVEYLGDDSTEEEDPTTSYRNLHMEYMPGGTVADMASNGADVDESVFRAYTQCIVSALKYIHSKNIVHCDVKGKNVLVGATPGSAKLADFGSAKQISDGNTSSSPRGSPLWMAPEVIRGEFQGKESDVWSLGCTVIEMVTGKPAWEDNGADALLKIGFSNELPKIPIRLSELGRDFLEKCLRRNPSERWSCDQLLQHPFVSNSNSSFDSSPRCILDWANSEFEEEDEEEAEFCSNFSQISNFNFDTEEEQVVSARGRISKLVTELGENWESNGWVTVRSSITKEEEIQMRRNSGYSYCVEYTKNNGDWEYSGKSEGEEDRERELEERGWSWPRGSHKEDNQRVYYYYYLHLTLYRFNPSALNAHVFRYLLSEFQSFQMLLLTFLTASHGRMPLITSYKLMIN